MNRKYTTIILLCIMQMILVGSVRAQFVRLEKYPTIPVEYEAAFVDQVSKYVSGVTKSLYGQYFGQMTPEGNVYGYGTFYTDLDGDIYGLFRNGDLAFGIKKGLEVAKVGTNEHYIAYDLNTGLPSYIMKDNTKYNPSPEIRENNKFLVFTYPNGDKYVGETTQNRRNGYGLYFYANGDYYYGRYKDNKQVGYGAMFRQEKQNIVIQYWDPLSQEEQ